MNNMQWWFNDLSECEYLWRSYARILTKNLILYKRIENWPYDCGTQYMSVKCFVIR